MAPPILDRLSALGDETRARILAVLDGNELTVGEICRALQLPQPSVSRHLKTLAGDGWVDARSEGRNRHYRLSAEMDEAGRALWELVHRQVSGSPRYTEDRERTLAVLAERSSRSVAYFASAAEGWDAQREELFGSGAGWAPLLGLLDPGWVVADLGVGTGSLAERVAPFVERVIGVDRSDEMLSAASKRLSHAANVELRTGALEALPLDDAEVDLVVMALVLHHVADPVAVLREARRALGHGGRLLLLDMRPHERGHEFAERMGHVWPGFEAERVVAWLDEAGFRRSRLASLPADPDATGPLLFLATAIA